MALYFLVLDRTVFHEEICPALAASWRERSFGPCRKVCARWLPTAQDFAARYHVGAGEPLLAQIGRGLPFDRALWQHVAGELLWFSAVEIPEIETGASALAYLLAPQGRPDAPRPALPPILQAHHGSRDLFFGGGFYRPDHAGWNSPDDIARLATYLNAVRPENWHADDLAGVIGLAVEEREEELAWLRDWFPALQMLYTQAAERGRVIVCESLE